MSAYNLFLQPMSYFCWYSTCLIVFIPRPVTTGFDWFFCGSGPWFLHSEAFWTGPVCDPSKKGNRTEIEPDFSVLLLLSRVAVIFSSSDISRVQKKKKKKKKNTWSLRCICVSSSCSSSPLFIVLEWCLLVLPHASKQCISTMNRGTQFDKGERHRQQCRCVSRHR